MHMKQRDEMQDKNKNAKQKQKPNHEGKIILHLRKRQELELRIWKVASGVLQRSHLGMKLERCHLKMSPTTWCWCSRLGGLQKPILMSPQALGPREAPEALVAPHEL